MACGFEDPATVSLGALNLTYPDALHVGTAVWQARQDGLLRDPVTAATGPAAQWEALRGLDQLRQHWPTGGPSIAIVLVPAVMWSRLMTMDDAVILQAHVAGPLPGDRVLVTDPDALRAWMAGQITTNDMLERGLLRTYGDAAERNALHQTLLALFSAP
jgi:hypothetical protein